MDRYSIARGLHPPEDEINWDISTAMDKPSIFYRLYEDPKFFEVSWISDMADNEAWVMPCGFNRGTIPMTKIINIGGLSV